MWQSQDDIVKDLASLDEFNIPGNEEPYKVLYSIGRGSKLKSKQKCSENFIDSRTGEIIKVSEEIDDYSDSYKAKGRASLLGGFSKSKYQLQQQLRLARPLGSGDEAIESYCRRNQSRPGSKCSLGTSDSESDTKNEKITSETSSFNSNSNKMNQRVKAVRNSNVENNALISGLLTKSKEKSKIGISDKKGNVFNEFDEENVNVADSIKSNNHSDSESSASDCVTAGTSMTNFNDVGVLLNRDLSGRKCFLKNIYSSPLEVDEAVQMVVGEGFNVIYDEEGREKQRQNKRWEDERIKNYSKSDPLGSAGTSESDRDEKYRRLGEKLNRLREFDRNTGESRMYDFSQISRHSAQVEENSDVHSFTSPKTVAREMPKYFVINDDEFPPLGN